MSKDKADIFEVELTDTYHYRLSYGGQSPFFVGLQNKQLIASRCSECGHVWLPLRPICSRCYADAAQLSLSGKAQILTSVVLPDVPEHLRHLGAPVASALVIAEGAPDTCMKVFVASKSGTFAKGTPVTARYLPEIRTIADFYFTTD